jgi:hypothetical protein
MPPRGRPRNPGTEEERAAARREQVRENVRAFRKRQQISSKSPPSSDSGVSSRALSAGPSQVMMDPTLVLRDIPERRLAITQELRGPTDPDGVGWSLQFPYQLNLGPAYPDAFIAATQDPYITGKDSVKIDISCGTWNAMAIVEVSSPGASSLADALLASGLNVIGLSQNDERLVRQGLEVHDRALRRLRLALNGYTEVTQYDDRDGETLTTLSTVTLACAMTELLGNKSWEKFAVHLSGVGALLQCGGPAALNNSTSAQAHFYGYRTVQLPFSFIYRQRCFLSQSQWIEVPWRYDNENSTRPLQRLIDIALQIPSAMESYDTEPVRDLSTLSESLRNLVRIRGDLEIWQKNAEHNFSTTLESQIDLIDRHLTGYSQEFIFDDPEIAHAFTYYVGVRLGLLELALEVAQGLANADGLYEGLVQKLIAETITWCTVAAQCLNFFFRRTDISGKLLCFFTFEMAFKMIRKLRTDVGMVLQDHEQWFLDSAEAFKRSGLPVTIRE